MIYEIKSEKRNTLIPPSPLQRLCRNGGGGDFKEEQRVRFISFRMRSLKIMGHRRYSKSDSFQGLGVTRAKRERLPP
jgi:hypothetical protein